MVAAYIQPVERSEAESKLPAHRPELNSSRKRVDSGLKVKLPDKPSLDLKGVVGGDRLPIWRQERPRMRLQMPVLKKGLADLQEVPLEPRSVVRKEEYEEGSQPHTQLSPGNGLYTASYFSVNVS